MKILRHIRALSERSSKHGIFLPMAYDPDQHGPSVTLLAFYIALLMASASVTALHFFPGIKVATAFTLMFLFMTYIFYKFRRLNRVNLDLENKSVNLEGDSEPATVAVTTSTVVTKTGGGDGAS